jgi:hypothetical protein
MMLEPTIGAISALAIIAWLVARLAVFTLHTLVCMVQQVQKQAKHKVSLPLQSKKCYAKSIARVLANTTCHKSSMSFKPQGRQQRKLYHRCSDPKYSYLNLCAAIPANREARDSTPRVGVGLI